MQHIGGWFVGSYGQQALGLSAILAVGIATYAFAAIILGVLDKATMQRLMRRQS